MIDLEELQDLADKADAIDKIGYPHMRIALTAKEAFAIINEIRDLRERLEALEFVSIEDDYGQGHVSPKCPECSVPEFAVAKGEKLHASDCAHAVFLGRALGDWVSQ